MPSLAVGSPWNGELAMLCALVQNNTVVQVVTIPDDGGASYAATAAAYQAAIDITNTLPQPQVGWTLSGNTLVANGAPMSMKLTKLAFQERFTLAELVAIKGAEQGTTTNALTLQVMDGQESVATYIDLTLTATIQSVWELVALGLLTSARANQILTTPPAASEVYQG